MLKFKSLLCRVPMGFEPPTAPLSGCDAWSKAVDFRSPPARLAFYVFQHWILRNEVALPS